MSLEKYGVLKKRVLSQMEKQTKEVKLIALKDFAKKYGRIWQYYKKTS